MATTTESTFGAKLANAVTISTHLKSFNGYIAPTADTTIEAYDALITTIKTENSKVVSQRANYSSAVETRLKLFANDSTSVAKLISPILSTVRATLGKNTKEVSDISTIAEKIRGKNSPKAKEGGNVNTISQSELSYGSKTQNFSDLISILVSLGTAYNPANENVKLITLQTKLEVIDTANINVASTFGILKAGLDLRNSYYEKLSAFTQRIKESVKSQYGVASVEYKLVKGLKV
jgi:hypothetical protein